MAQDTTAKKSNFLSACVANAQQMIQCRNIAKALAEELASDATINALVDADCIGDNSHLTRTIVFNYLQGVQPPFEAMLTNGAVATINRLPQLLAMIPS